MSRGGGLCLKGVRGCEVVFLWTCVQGVCLVFCVRWVVFVSEYGRVTWVFVHFIIWSFLVDKFECVDVVVFK
ncbi:Uncharacterised protein [Dermatophilus congolensis]|uniref:Transmembrane protein n=1 Tax=Dermatophilus congolensis TaxID=1863 RepID=A0A239VCC2_9MICO|nr:Uncharacterised protein [Dermatophilus congolensis]